MPKEAKPVELEITVKRKYLFYEGDVDGRNPEEVVKEWFIDHSVNEYHATRDAMHVGGGDVVTDIKINSKPMPVAKPSLPTSDKPDHWVIRISYFPYGSMSDEPTQEIVDVRHSEADAIDVMKAKALQERFIYKVYETLSDGEHGKLLAIKRHATSIERIFYEQIKSK